MKRIALFLFAALFVFSACKKKETASPEQEAAAALAGKYVGQFTTGQSVKDATIHITQNPIIKENLYFEYVIGLTRIAENRYEYDGKQTDLTLIDLLFGLMGMGSDAITGTVERITIEARFSGSDVTLTIEYHTDLGVALTSEFTGTRQ